MLGVSMKARILVVCHCYRKSGAVIRIISARRATRKERSQYEVFLRWIELRKNYDFSKSKRNPYARVLKRQITIRLEQKTIEYFKQLSNSTGMPYQSLMNLYLRDCADHQKKLHFGWSAWTSPVTFNASYSKLRL
jgi:predicted DNA binding CopG/RHH family protein